MKHLLALAWLPLLASCYPAPPPAPPITPNPPGGVYRAVGTEPFWDLTIDARDLVFTDRGNNVRVAQPTPPVIGGIAGEIYQSPRIGVNIVHTPCSDEMSDRTYPDRVQVDVDGRRYNGCGGVASAPLPLAGSSWTVVRINGLATPQQGYFLNFTANRLNARFGCNQIGGDYRVEGNVLVSNDIVSTKMACIGPAGTFENAGLRVLNYPMTVTWRGVHQLELRGDGGTLELAREP